MLKQWIILQKKTLANLNFRSRDSLKSVIQIRNLIFIKSWFTFCYDVHNYETVSSTTTKMFKPSYRTDSHRKNRYR